MHESLSWVGVGAGGGLLTAATISVVLGGPGWPYYLGIGAVALVASLVAGLRSPGPDAAK